MNEIEQMYRNAGVEMEGENFINQFTTEKQLEVIKVLGQKDYYTCDYCNIKPRDDNEEWLSYCHFKSCTKHTFEESLAGLINKLWQDLTEDEKQKIREILR